MVLSGEEPWTGKDTTESNHKTRPGKTLLGTAGPGFVMQVSVRQRLIELEFEFGNGFRNGGIEPAGLIEFEEALERPSHLE